MTTHDTPSWTLAFNPSAAEHLVDWLLRDLPVTALRAVCRDEVADKIAAQPRITAKVMSTKTGLRRYQPPLRAASIALLIDDHTPPRWEIDAAMYAEIGSAPMDFAHEVEQGLIRGGGFHAGFWALQLVRNAYLLNPDGVAAHAQQCYHRLVDAAVLNGWGRLEL